MCELRVHKEMRKRARDEATRLFSIEIEPQLHLDIKDVNILWACTIPAVKERQRQAKQAVLATTPMRFLCQHDVEAGDENGARSCEDPQFASKEGSNAQGGLRAGALLYAHTYDGGSFSHHHKAT